MVARKPDDVNAECWHALSVAETAARLQTDIVCGLSQSEAGRRLAQAGPDVVSAEGARPALSILLAQFGSFLVLLLAVAAVTAFVLGETVEGVSILAVIVLNAGIGFFTEWKAQQALMSLQRQTVQLAAVIRDGRLLQVPAEQLVRGDLVILEAGSGVPADGRITESVRLQAVEAALTGESLPVSKTVAALSERDVLPGDRSNMAFLGTMIVDGRGRMLVTAREVSSEYGRIGRLIGAAVHGRTPLERKLARLGQLLLLVVVFLCAVIVLAGCLRGTADFWQMLEIGLSLAIAAVPEGLPAVTTMTLALGMQRMARMKSLVRRLPAVETLGSVTVICTDKTGTLTRNEMTVCAYVLGEREIAVSGTGYGLAGEFREGAVSLRVGDDEQLGLALRIGLLCNDARVERTTAQALVFGDPTEAALTVVAEKAGLQPAVVRAAYPRLSEEPFSSVSRRMVTVHRTAEGQTLGFFKGSPGVLLSASSSEFHAGGVRPLTAAQRRVREDANLRLATRALRVLGLAYRVLPERYDESDLQGDLIFAGLVGMSDPLRDEAQRAIARCREAGIRTVMITGDQQSTAAEIARQLGIDVDLQSRPLRIVHGRELSELDERGWQRVVAEAAVFARVSPEHKVQIVRALQQQGHVVAMTGDGVNDAPALKTADIGIAMGIRGTAVAKEQADMVITDDDFSSIVGAVEQGRIIYDNIIRFLHYLLSCNFSEILTIFLAMMLGWPLPLVALQILWLNLITDIFPAFALALEPSSPDAMFRPPRDPREPLLTLRFAGLIVWQGLLLATVTLLAFGVGLRWYGLESEGLRRSTTLAFMTLALTQVLHAFNARSQRRSIFTSRLFTNVWLWVAVAACLLLQCAAVYLPLFQRVLQTASLDLADWFLITGCSFLPVMIVELRKLIRRALIF